MSDIQSVIVTLKIPVYGAGSDFPVPAVLYGIRGISSDESITGEVNRMSQRIVVKAIIHNQHGQFLMQHRDNIAGIEEPDCWGFFGGGVEEGETLEGALERELGEELSCRVGQIEAELFRWKKLPEGVLHVCFSVRFTASNDDLVLQEGQGFAWFFLEELMGLTLGLLVCDNLSHLQRLACDRLIVKAPYRAGSLT
jgi:8-oxo-dGTP pyrophosphatase MutT (NUDIX family)